MPRTWCRRLCAVPGLDRAVFAPGAASGPGWGGRCGFCGRGAIDFDDVAASRVLAAAANASWRGRPALATDRRPVRMELASWRTTDARTVPLFFRRWPPGLQPQGFAYAGSR